jgi:hypothetical protein
MSGEILVALTQEQIRTLIAALRLGVRMAGFIGPDRLGGTDAERQLGLDKIKDLEEKLNGRLRR